MLLVGAGRVWGDDVAMAGARLPALRAAVAGWLEGPLVSGSLAAYAQLAKQSAPLKLAGGEGCHNFHPAKNMIDYAGLGYAQIDAGRIGGITSAKAVADYALARSVQFVNHTFTTPLALSASVQPYAGIEAHSLCEYPSEPSSLAREFCSTSLVPDDQGLIHLPAKPGLGIEPDLKALQKYLVPVEIK